MTFNRHEDDVRTFLAGKVESLITGRSGPRGTKGKKPRRQPEEGTSESGHQKRRREHEEAVIKILEEAALAGKFVDEHSLPIPLTSEQIHTENGGPSYPADELGESESNNTDTSGDEIISISSSEDTPSAPHHSPRKRNWKKRDIPNWSHDDKAVYEAICVYLKIGKGELHGKKAKRASSLYRAVLAKWRSVYKEADLLVSGLNEENVKKMLQRLKSNRESFERWVNDPSTAEHMADAAELHFLYPDRVRIFEDGSYAFVDKDGDLSGDRDVIYSPIEDDNDAEDDRIMKILADKGIFPPNGRSDIGAMFTYVESVRLQKQAERDQWEQEHKEAIERMNSELADCMENGTLMLEEMLSKASALPPPDLNAIFNVTSSNLSLLPSPRKDDPSSE